MFKTILVPLDGSESAERVLPAMAPLRSPETALRLVRAVPIASAGAAPLDRTRRIEAESYLSFLAAELGGTARAEVRRGQAVEEILAAAGAAGADLIALSARGESGARPFGSTAGRVIHAAGCPVFVLEAPARDPGLPRSKPSRVLVALDGSRESETALAPARAIARASGADIVLFHVVGPLWATRDSAMAGMQAAGVEQTHARLQELAARLAGEGLRARPLLSHGEPAAEIRSQAQRRRADLICLSTAGRGTVGQLFFGAVAQRLIGASPVPLIVVRRGEAPAA